MASRRPRREMKPLGTERIQRKISPLSQPLEIKHGWESKPRRIPLTKKADGKLELTDKGRDYYLKKRVERVFPAIVDAFLPSLYPEEREKLIESAIKSARGARPREDKKMKKKGFGAHVQIKPKGLIPTEFEMVFSKWLKEASPIPDEIFAHESLHYLVEAGRLKVKNIHLAVNALSVYFNLIEVPALPTKMKYIDRKLEEEKEMLKPPSTLRTLGVAKKALKTRKSLTEAFEEEYYRVGELLGIKAAQLERKTGQPGLGLFFIREVCKGFNPKSVEWNLMHATVPSLKRWQQRHGRQWFGKLYTKAFEIKIAMDRELRELEKTRHERDSSGKKRVDKE